MSGCGSRTLATHDWAVIERLRSLPNSDWDTLTQSSLAKMLKVFEDNEGKPIKTKTVWPKQRTRSSPAKSGSGYYRYQFENAWGAYCDDEPPPAPKSRKTLRSGAA